MSQKNCIFAPKTLHDGLSIQPFNSLGMMMKRKILLLFVALCPLLGFGQQIYDRSGSFLGKYESGCVYGRSGSYEGKVDAGRFYSRSGSYLGYMQDGRFYDGSGSYVGHVKDNRYYDRVGSYVGHVKDGCVYDRSGSMIGRASNVPGNIVALVFFYGIYNLR